MASRWIQTESGSTVINRNRISAVFIDEKLRVGGAVYIVTAAVGLYEYKLKTFLTSADAKAWMREMFKPRTKED